MSVLKKEPDDIKFQRRLNELLENKKIYQENRDFFRLFFEKEEYKLRRMNGLSKHDSGTYKTLFGYLTGLVNVNTWFNNKPLKDMTKEEFKKFYDDFEDGKIISEKTGKPYSYSTRKTYYLRIFRSHCFELIGKRQMVNEVMAFHGRKQIDNNDVRYITEEDFRRLENFISNPVHKLLLWLCWDYGENIMAMLNLKKNDFALQHNDLSKDPEYKLILRKEILKRSRTARTSVNNYKETVELLDSILPELNNEDKIFNFSYGNAKQIIERAGRLSKVKCVRGQDILWKDLRSSMACDLLKKGWSTDEVNARLGHKPSSTEIDKYENILALNSVIPKRKVYEHNLGELKGQIQKQDEIMKLTNLKLEEVENKASENEKFNQYMIEKIRNDLTEQIEMRLKGELMSMLEKVKTRHKKDMDEAEIENNKEMIEVLEKSKPIIKLIEENPKAIIEGILKEKKLIIDELKNKSLQEFVSNS